MITNSFQTEKLLEMRIRYLVTSSFLNDDNKANAMVKDVRSALQNMARLVANLFVASVTVFCWVEGNGFVPNDRTPCLS